MSFVTIVDDDSDVTVIRKMLTQAGTHMINIHFNTEAYAFSSGSSNFVYTPKQDIIDVAGIWLESDYDNIGTNYISGATVYPEEGRIDLAISLPPMTEIVLITYASRNGLSDQQIQYNIDMAKYYLTGELWKNSINFSGSSTFEIMSKWTMLTIASYWCVLAMNNSNAIQSGFNFRIAEFEIQTKLWGEGMIAETLLSNYWNRAMRMMNALKLFETNPEPPIFVVDRSNNKVPYNKNPLIFSRMSNIDVIRQHDSKSRYAIIMSVVG